MWTSEFGPKESNLNLPRSIPIAPSYTSSAMIVLLFWLFVGRRGEYTGGGERERLQRQSPMKKKALWKASLSLVDPGPALTTRTSMADYCHVPHHVLGIGFPQSMGFFIYYYYFKKGLKDI